MTDSLNETESDDYTDVVLQKVVKNGIYITKNLSNLGENVFIFTLPIITFFDCTLNVKNIFMYFPLSKSDISTIKSEFGIRTLSVTEKIIKKNMRSNFMNQITIIMSIYTDETLSETKHVNIKMFNNGSIQISGLKSIFQCNYTINKLVNLLKGEFTIYTKKGKNKSQHIFKDNVVQKTIKFIEDVDGEIWICEPTICTINMTCRYKTKINQSQLYYKIKELKLHGKIPEKIVVLLQTDINSPVTIWLNSCVDESRYLTIELFESGSISIMACKCRDDFTFAYDFIMNILTTYEEVILKKDIVAFVKNSNATKQYVDIDEIKKVEHLY